MSSDPHSFWQDLASDMSGQPVRQSTQLLNHVENTSYGTWMAVAILPVIFIWVLVFQLAFLLADQKETALLSHHAEHATKRSQHMATSFKSGLDQLARWPQAMASNPSVIATLGHLESENLAHMDDQLSAHLQSDLLARSLNEELANYSGAKGLDLIWVMRLDGIAVASSDYQDRNALIGRNFSEQEFFRLTLNNGLGNQFVKEGPTKSPSIHVAALAFREKTRMGVVAARIDVEGLRHLLDHSHSVVTDPFGMVILSTDKEWEGRIFKKAALENLDPQTAKSNYQLEDVPEIAVSTDFHLGQMLVTDASGRSSVWQSWDVADYGLKVHAFETIQDVWVARSEAHQLGWAAALAATGFYLMVLAIFYWRRRERVYQLEVEGLTQSLEQSQQDLANLSIVDPLTGAYNRRHFVERLEKELARHRRYHTDLSVFLVNLDHFRKVNDTYGHAFGDIVLKQITMIARSLLRDNDFWFRTGGEEFVALMPETALAGAQVVAERMREAISISGFGPFNNEISLTVSMGLTGAGLNDDTETIMKRAEEALFDAKRHGRNRVVSRAPES